MQQVTKPTLYGLKEQLFHQLDVNQYSEIYKYYFRIRFLALEKFMVQNGLTDYSDEIGKSFLEDYRRTRNVSQSAMYALNSFINRLNDINDGHGFIFRHFMGDPIPLSADFKVAASNYISSCKERGNVQTTLNWKTGKCTYFCFLVQQLGCESPGQLTASLTTKACLQIKNKDAWRCVREFL